MSDVRRAGKRIAVVFVCLVIFAPGLPAAGAPEVDVVRVETALAKAIRVRHVPQDAREFSPFAIRTPGQEQVQIVSVRYDETTPFLLDIYYPPSVHLSATPEGTLPVMLVPQGFHATTMESYGLRTPMEQAFLMGWGMFFAMQGTACVLYDADDLSDGFDRAVRYLQRHADELGLDLERLGMFGTSGHGEFADFQLRHEFIRDRLDAAIFLHGNQRGVGLGRHGLAPRDRGQAVLPGRRRRRTGRPARGVGNRIRSGGHVRHPFQNCPVTNFRRRRALSQIAKRLSAATMAISSSVVVNTMGRAASLFWLWKPRS